MDSLDEHGLDGVVEACVVVICQMASVGIFVEAVGQGPVRFRRYNRYTVGKLSGGSGCKGMTGWMTSWMVS